MTEGSSNVELAHVDMPDIRQKYGFPHTTEHRSALAGGLLNACKREPAITFHFATALESVQSFSPRAVFTVKPRDGEPQTVEADVLLAADGIKSPTRGQLLARLDVESAAEEDTGQAAYRIMLSREQMATDPELLSLLDSDLVVRWIGERRHIIAYPVSGHSIYNLSSAQPDDNFAAGPSATYTTKGSKEAMLKVFEDFCPLVQKMLQMVPDGEVCEWKLRQHKPLPAWTLGAVALLGDACHPTLPHLSQGAAMAIEDGAVLAEVLSRVSSTPPDGTTTNGDGHGAGAIARCLHVYEQLRKERTTMLVEMAAFSGRTLHLGEGKAREERDRQFRENGSRSPTSGRRPTCRR